MRPSLIPLIPMHLTLLVPGLVWPREVLRDTTFDLPLPALSRLLGRGRRLPGVASAAWLAETFGLPSPLPAAPLRLLGEGVPPGDGCWLCLDPIHLRLEERALVVDDPARLVLAADEDAALRAALAPLVAPLGELAASAPGHWHVRLPAPVALDTRSLEEALGRPADPALPTGADGAAWRRLLAEAQTLLHDHPVNRAREAAGRPTVNSLWPWGHGRLPRAGGAPFDLLWSPDPVLRGLAALSGLDAAMPPRRFETAPARVLARLDHLKSAAAGYDALAWREAMTALEAEWLAPAVAALAAGRCRRLHLLADGEGPPIRVTAGRLDLWKFWRPARPLFELAP